MSGAYERAGVNIKAGYEAVDRMKQHVQRTMRPEVIGGLGGFGGMFELPVDRFRQPVLISGTDGVGTKLKIAFAMNRHDTIGQDAVAMCVNDIVAQGAEPLYMLDYLACGKLDPSQSEAIVAGFADGCQQAGCALIGGETAEMPGFYADGEYDLAGFAVGIVEKERIVDGTKVVRGDVLIGLSSSGLHSNGFSLVRKVLFEQEGLAVNSKLEELGQQTLGELLLTPTRIYVQPVLRLLETCHIHGMAHITGGGFYENIPRMLPADCAVEIERGSWSIPGIFPFLAERGKLTEEDMYNTFNMGIGFVLAVPEAEAGQASTEAGPSSGVSPVIR
jgi:phosphoribosylformylglycinamidine cyclo-ligase